MHVCLPVSLCLHTRVILVCVNMQHFQCFCVLDQWLNIDERPLHTPLPWRLGLGGTAVWHRISVRDRAALCVSPPPSARKDSNSLCIKSFCFSKLCRSFEHVSKGRQTLLWFRFDMLVFLCTEIEFPHILSACLCHSYLSLTISFTSWIAPLTVTKKSAQAVAYSVMLPVTLMSQIEQNCLSLYQTLTKHENTSSSYLFEQIVCLNSCGRTTLQQPLPAE